MILSDNKIRAAMAQGRIGIRPVRSERQGTNTSEVHLGPFLSVYREAALDARRRNPAKELRIPKEGFVLIPGQL